MDTAMVRSFLDGRLRGGLSDRDVRDLVAQIAPAGAALSAADQRALREVLADYESRFTSGGRSALATLTGLSLTAPSGGRSGGGASIVNVRAGTTAPVPRGWDEIQKVSAVMSRLIDEGESVTLRLGSGRSISLEANERMTEFVKKGYFKLYKNERDSSDSDDNGRTLWYAGYYLVPTPAFSAVEQQVEKFSKRGDKITKAITTAMERLHQVMHASRVNGLAPFDLAKIKAEVAAELPKAKAALIAYEDACEQFARDTQHIDYPNGDVYLMMLAKDALKVTGPRIEALSMRDLVFVKDLIRANELLLPLPEVESVDPGFGIRVSVNTDVLVKNGGDYTVWKAEKQMLLEDALITGEINWDKNNNSDGVLDAGKALLRKKLGAASVTDGWSIGDKDYRDGVRGTEVSYTVKADKLAAAQALIPELRALFAPHGFDMKHFDVTIEAE